MGKRKLGTSMIIGAVLGGLVALRHPEVRNYTREKLSTAKSTTVHVAKHPSAAIRQVRLALNKFNYQFANQADNAINALEQIESTLNKVTKESESDTKVIN